MAISGEIDFDRDVLLTMLESILRHDLIECREKLSVVLPFTDKEKQFLDRILDAGSIEPELLTDDTRLQERIRNHPMLVWKSINVKKHHGL